LDAVAIVIAPLKQSKEMSKKIQKNLKHAQIQMNLEIAIQNGVYDPVEFVEM